MAEVQNLKFCLMESAQIPLQEVTKAELKSSIIDPTTGKPYDGIILEGIFADLSQEPNNNKRIYDEEQYLVLLEKLKQQVQSKKGVYGELEHPDRYSVNYNYVSHKIIDIWYDYVNHLVRGRVLLLNTPKGLIAQEIIKSGGLLAISARAAGDEIKQADGTFKAVVRLLTTYDLVYHPGFSDAILEYETLNESQKLLYNAGKNKSGFFVKIYLNQFGQMNDAYMNYLGMNESEDLEDISERRSMCFLEWFGKKLFESQKESSNQEENEQEILQKNEPVDKKEKQQKLKNAVNKELNEENYLKARKKLMFQEASQAQKRLRKRPAGNFYDNSAGFVNTGMSTSLSEDDD